MSPINEEDRAELVAYLDGELDEEASQVFEVKLTRDKQLREEAEALKKTWELLDFLPRAEPSPSFTHRTLERLSAHDTGRAPVVGSARRWVWAAPAAWAAAMLVAVIGGGLAGHYLWKGAPPSPPAVSPQPDVEAQIIGDLDVIRHKRLYDNAENLEFLKGLAKTLDDEEAGS